MHNTHDNSNENESLFHILHRAEQRAKQLFSEEARGLGLTMRQLVILDAVKTKENLMQAEIVQLTGIDRSTVTELVGRMVKRGLLVRSRNNRDARAYIVRTTAEGRERLDAAEMASKRAGARFLEVLPIGSRESFVRGLQRAAELES